MRTLLALWWNLQQQCGVQVRDLWEEQRLAGQSTEVDDEDVKESQRLISALGEANVVLTTYQVKNFSCYACVTPSLSHSQQPSPQRLCVDLVLTLC